MDSRDFVMGLFGKFYCKQCEKEVEVKIIEKYPKKTWTEIQELGTFGDVPTKVRCWKRYGKVIVLPHTKKVGFFKKIQCPNSNTQVKMQLEGTSWESY